MRLFLFLAILSTLHSHSMAMFALKSPKARKINPHSRDLTTLNNHNLDKINRWLKNNDFKNPHHSRSYVVTRYGGYGESSWTGFTEWGWMTFIHPIHLAIEQKNFEVIRCLLEQGVDTNTENNHHLTPLMAILSSCNSQELSKHLCRLDNKPIKPNDKDWDYEDPVTLELMNLLIVYEADINYQNKYKKTALHYGAQGGNNAEPFVKLLLKHGASVNVPDMHDFTPLHEASRSSDNSKNIIEVLIAHGADLTALNSEPYMGKKMTPYEVAIHTKKTYPSKRYFNDPDIFRLLKPKKHTHQPDQRERE